MNPFTLHTLAALAAGVALALPVGAHAGLDNDVPSCYVAHKLSTQSAPADKLFYVLIDQTVELDDGLKASVRNSIRRMVQPGSRFVISQFSAFSQGRYLEVLNTGFVESPMTEEQAGNVPMSKVPGFNACMKQQGQYALGLMDKAALSAMNGATHSLNQSDILSALKQVSVAIKEAPEKNKVLFLVTDALENSSITSFYTRNSVAKIDPAKEMQKVSGGDLVGDFGGARVYVLGAGLLKPSTTGSRAERDGYRDPDTMRRLQTFWGEYFGKSNAHLVEFGAPALLQPTTY